MGTSAELPGPLQDVRIKVATNNPDLELRTLVDNLTEARRAYEQAKTEEFHAQGALDRYLRENYGEVLTVRHALLPKDPWEGVGFPLIKKP